MSGRNTIIVTASGDTVDHVCWRHYGTTAGQVVEQVLAANPGLADRGALLPAGIEVQLPAIIRPGQSKGLRLWD